MASPPHAPLELVRRVLIVRAALWQLDAIESEEQLRLAKTRSEKIKNLCSRDAARAIKTNLSQVEREP